MLTIRPLKTGLTILCLYTLLFSGNLNAQEQSLSFDFFGEPVCLKADKSLIINLNSTHSREAITSFAGQLNNAASGSLVNGLLGLREKLKLDDWLYYQLIRRTAQSISPKSADYYRYTLYKWFLLTRSGYDATIRLGADKMLFYVRTDENIYEIPFYKKNDRQYVCLNYHDYGNHIDFSVEKFEELLLPEPGEDRSFSYKITRLPEFRESAYQDKQIEFNYYQTDYKFTIKLNPEVKTLFANYPVVDYASYFNIPLSHETYSSLIPLLKKNVYEMTVKSGVDYLMRFTRYAFMFKPDAENFGGEKRLSPEQTLLYPESDCEDRAALFFYLVKEIYNLPMIVLAYPKHVTIAVKFDKPVGKSVLYHGEKYSVCEPTPQKTDLGIGKLLPALRKQPFEVVYAYTPSPRN